MTVIIKNIQLKWINIISKLIIAIFVFIATNHAPNSFGFYRLLRIICTVNFLIIALYEFQIQKYLIAFVGLFGAILFNPVYPVVFKRQEWIKIDNLVLIIIVLAILLDTFNFIKLYRKNRI